MATESQPDTVSKEAHERITRERDELKAQVTEATRALDDYARRDAARSALKGKVEDPDSVADLITPHLRDLKAEDVAAHVASEAFAPKLAPFKAAAAPPPEGAAGDGSDDGKPASTEPGSNGFGGPSPGNDSGSTAPDGKQMIQVGSPEFNKLAADDPKALEAAYNEGRVAEPTRSYR